MFSVSTPAGEETSTASDVCAPLYSAPALNVEIVNKSAVNKHLAEPPRP